MMRVQSVRGARGAKERERMPCPEPKRQDEHIPTTNACKLYGWSLGSAVVVKCEKEPEEGGNGDYMTRHSALASSRVGRDAFFGRLLPSFLSSVRRCIARLLFWAARVGIFFACLLSLVLEFEKGRRCTPAALRYHFLASSTSCFVPIPTSE